MLPDNTQLSGWHLKMLRVRWTGTAAFPLGNPFRNRRCWETFGEYPSRSVRPSARWGPSSPPASLSTGPVLVVAWHRLRLQTSRPEKGTNYSMNNNSLWSLCTGLFCFIVILLRNSNHRSAEKSEQTDKILNLDSSHEPEFNTLTLDL